MINSPGLAWWTVRRAADECGAHHIRLVPTGSRVETLFDSGVSDDMPLMSDAVLSVLAMRLKRMGTKTGWHVDVHEAGFAPAIHLTRRRVESRPTHPSDWAEAYTSFREEPEGLLVLIRPDAYLARHGLARLSGAGIETYDVDDEESRELVMHAALSGTPAVAVASDDEAWWEPIAGAVPIRILRSHRTSEGSGWESYSL